MQIDWKPWKIYQIILRWFSTILGRIILKGIISQSEWEEIAEDISINFLEDNYFAELKENEILKERIDMLDSLSDHIGKFYSTKWIRNNILRQSD